MDIPTSAWDCHTHCFHPHEHPFKSTRSYTPAAATMEELERQVLTENVMIVQASVEDGCDGLLDTLRSAKLKIPNKIIRGTVAADTEPGKGLNGLSPSDFARLHELGVRSIRIHGSYGGAGSDASWAKDQLRHAATMYPVVNLGWSISAQLPLKTWSAISEVLEQDINLRKVVLLADHNGCATPEHLNSPEMGAFVAMLEKGQVYVKIGALHRRAKKIEDMEKVVKLFAAKAPERILWGSDWPHVDPSRGGLDPTPHLSAVSDSEELRLLRSWLTEAQWEMMLVRNPGQLFA
ncbi:amidohydrolase domain-containing protein [Sarocladium implicatum]|nr:amidohydrolase domain-containing protein [Sarocladium implicatum]